MTDFTDADLLAYIDGLVQPGTAAQIERSTELMDRVRALRSLESSLHAKLFRAGCPDPQQLGEYHLNLLPASQASEVRQHLRDCLYCAEELRQLEAFMAPGLVERARVIVAELLSGGPAAAPLPAAGVRGGEPGPSIYLAGSLQIILEIQPEPHHPELRSLNGLVTGRAAGGMEVQLNLLDLPPLTEQVGEMGEFSFSDLAPGEYTLRLLSPEEEIQVPAFSIE